MQYSHKIERDIIDPTTGLLEAHVVEELTLDSQVDAGPLWDFWYGERGAFADMAKQAPATAGLHSV